MSPPIRVRNPVRVQVSLPEFVGRAALTEGEEGAATLAFVPNRGEGRTKVGNVITLDVLTSTARQARVEKVGQSEHVAGMTILDLRLEAPAAAE